MLSFIIDFAAGVVGIVGLILGIYWLIFDKNKRGEDWVYMLVMMVACFGMCIYFINSIFG